MDKFLGRATLPLGPALQAGRAPRDQWYKLHSKAGKKEKERGEIQVTIQFTRNNMTASMFDLSMKDKPRSPFGKLKDKMKGKKKYDLESASAIIPSSMGALDVEDYDFGGKKSKTKGFFLKNKLRKSSLTQSNTSLGSDSTISSASSSLANNFGISINAPEVTKSPSRHSSLSTERSVKDYLPSPKLTHKRAFSDEVSQVSTVPESKSIQSLKPKNEPVSRSSLCINGSHIYSDEPTPKSPMSAQQSSLPLSVPLQNVAKRPEEGFSPIPFPPDSQEPSWRGSSFEKTQPKEEPRFIPSPPSLVLQEELKVSTKAVTLSNHLGRARMEEGGRIETKPVQIATPMVFSGEPAKEEGRKEDKKTRGGLFYHRGKADAGEKSLGEKQGTTQASQVMAGEEKSKTSWFSSKDTKEPSQKPSFPPGPQATTEVAESLCSSADSGPSGSITPKDPQKESSAQSTRIPVPETAPTLPEEDPTAPPALSEWDDTFDAFATSRLKPEVKEESLFGSLAMEGMAYIDDLDGASPTDRCTELVQENQTEITSMAEPQTDDEVAVGLETWGNVTLVKGSEVGLANAGQEATLTEEVTLSRLSPDALVESGKNSTSQVWFSRFALPLEIPREEHASPPVTAQTAAREEWYREDMHGEKPTEMYKEEPTSPGEDKGTTVGQEPFPWLSESDRDLAASGQKGQENECRQRMGSDKGVFQEESSSLSASHILTRSGFDLEKPGEVLSGNSAAAVLPPGRPEDAVEPSLTARDHGSNSKVVMVGAVPPACGLPASTQEEAEESNVQLRPDSPETQEGSSPWTEPQEIETESDRASGLELHVGMPPPKPPRRFTPLDFSKEDDQAHSDLQRSQRGVRGDSENGESPVGEMHQQNAIASRENMALAAPIPPALRPAVIEAKAGSVPLMAEDAKSAAEDRAANLEAKNNELTKWDTSSGESLLEINEEMTGEQFETCPSKLSLDELGAKDNSDKLGAANPDFPARLIGAAPSQQITQLCSTGQADGTGGGLSEAAPAVPELKEIPPARPHAPGDPDVCQPVLFWTALEEQPSASHSQADQPERLGLSKSPPELASKSAQRDSEEPLGHQEGPGQSPKNKAEAQASRSVEGLAGCLWEPEQGSCSAREAKPLLGRWPARSVAPVIDFKKADFWKQEGAEESSKQDDTCTLGNPFTPLASPPAPTNPFVGKPPSTLPAPTTSPEMPGQGALRFIDPHEEAAPPGFQPANFPGDRLVEHPFLHGKQPLAFSTPFLVAATNSEQFDFPSPIVRATTGGVPAVTSQAAAQPYPLPQPGGPKASTLVVLPKETQPAEKAFFQPTTSPHPVKPISAAVSEVSSEKKQHRSSLTSALSSGLEKLKTVTTGSIQPVAPSTQLEKAEHKKLKDPALPDQSAKYYHLTHDELIQLLLQREKELSKKEEHIQELENYIDRLLVRIMEQSPTLLQIPLEETKTSK
ncbi:PREDICTED: rab11 family-interacting protein 5 [Crocodylus porosus]|uniref:rab11 family-interacting protein 5 n=1 Tax=Crocodylus porosus TaxID=8502 RepID=UPI00093B642C|nr:PREDICTED: rab11 family-interacting protein 5 [Crocodylus porosus]